MLQSYRCEVAECLALMKGLLQAKCMPFEQSLTRPLDLQQDTMRKTQSQPLLQSDVGAWVASVWSLT